MLRASPNPVSRGAVASNPAGSVWRFRAILWILMLSTGYHWMLTALQTNAGLRVSPGSVALVEFFVYMWVVLVVVFKRLPIKAFAVFFLGLGSFFVFAVARDGYLDVKGIRDLLIPSLFYVLAAQSGFSADLERKAVIWVSALVVVGLVIEFVLSDRYGRFFNTFRYHSSIGSIAPNAAHFKGMDVTLNALRPEGIGKTALSFLVGQRRLSSVFIEPVSLGNFAVVLSAWLMSHSRAQWRSNAWLWVAVTLMALLSDSRFAMMSIGVLLALRALLPVRGLRLVSLLAPLVGVVLVLFVANFYASHQDNLQGRLTAAGIALQNLPVEGYFGLKGYFLPLGDMGYAYMAVHFGLPAALGLWGWVALRSDGDERHQVFRALALTYMAMILAVSGSSVFALKTAGLLWFLIGLGEARRWSAPVLNSSQAREAGPVHA